VLITYNSHIICKMSLYHRHINLVYRSMAYTGPEISVQYFYPSKVVALPRSSILASAFSQIAATMSLYARQSAFIWWILIRTVFWLIHAFHVLSSVIIKCLWGKRAVRRHYGSFKIRGESHDAWLRELSYYTI